MADAASFVVALVDKVTGPARAAMKSVSGLTQRFQAAKTAADRARQSQEAAWRAMGRTQDKNGRWREANGRFVGDGRGPRVPGVVGNVKWKEVWKLAEKGNEKIIEVGKSAVKWGAFGAAAIGTGLGYALVKNTVQMAIFEDQSKMAFKSLTGSVTGGQKAWDSSLVLARQLGMGVEDTVGSMKHLLAMQFTLPQAEEMVRMSADLQAVTGDAHSAERALTAITQIKAKGKLQAEELVGQLAEANVSTTLVYQELQKSMNLKSTGDVQKAITAGKVDADTGIAAIKAAIGHKTHSSTAGQAGAAYAQNTYGGLIGQLKNAPQFLFVRLGEAVAANLEKLKPVVDKVIQAIDNIKGDQMARFVGNVLQFVERLVPLGLAFAQGFGEGFSSMNDALGALDPSQASLETAKEMGQSMAHAFELAFKAIGKVAEAIMWLDQHRGVLVGILSLLGAVKVASLGVAAAGLATKLGLLGGGATAATTAATTAASAGAFGSLGGSAAAAGGGLTGLAALKAGLGAVTLGAAGAFLAAAGGLGAAGYSYANREEYANKMLGWWGNDQAAAQRGLGPASPTALTSGLQGATARAPTTNQVRFDSQIHIDGTGQDPNAIGRAVGDQQRGMLEQFFQSQALEAGAMG